MIYYVAELENLHSYRMAEKINAKSLRGAKSWASRNQCFYNTVLVVGTGIKRNRESLIVQQMIKAGIVI